VLVWEPGQKAPDNDLQTGCSRNGLASSRDMLPDGRRHPGLFWSWQAPFREVSQMRGYHAP